MKEEEALAIIKLEQIHKTQRESLYEFLLYYREVERKVKVDRNRHLELICQRLEDVYYWKTKRLIINVPPRSLKTEIVSIAFPAWCIGKKPHLKFMGISYASWLAEDNSSKCRSMYESDTYLSIFPRRVDLREDQNTKQHRENTEWWQYYASGATGTITWKGCDIMVIDDPLKPWDAMSDIVRIGVNNNYHNTLYSRLNNKSDWAIVIIMQRLHDDDLCWHLIEQETHGEQREKLIIPAIAEDDDQYRRKWESFFEKRFPIEMLYQMQKQDPLVFSSQYQQEPTNKETQEFHEERFRYYDELPAWLRVMTLVDPAFKTWQENDQSAIITVWFKDEKMYVIEITAWRFPADVLQDKIIYHIRKWNAEKIWIEAFQAQSVIVTFLKQQLIKLWMYCSIEEIRQTGDKNAKIRKLIPFYRNGIILHNRDCMELEKQLIKFPRAKHDDIIDALQMAYNTYQLMPNTKSYRPIQIEYDQNWNVIYN